MAATLINFWELSAALRNADWTTSAFSYAKAYVCSIFSEWTYAAIPKLELNQAKLERFSLFNASAVYAELMNSQRSLYFQDFIRLQSREYRGSMNVLKPEFLTMEYDEFWVFLAFRLDDCIFIAIRGTILCAQDITDDFNYGQTHSLNGVNDTCKIHKGFYKGINNCFRDLIPAIENKIGKLTSKNKIYVMGHSLGGALSAVLHGIWNRQLPPSTEFEDLPQIFSSYTFGMPRYGNEAALNLFETNDDHPHHVLNPWDGVPQVPPKLLRYVPPRFLKYADSKFEYSSVADERPATTREAWKKGGFLEGLFYSPFRVSHHSIENYIQDIKKLA